jgi:sugar phosphate isomerase/epimerase
MAIEFSLTPDGRWKFDAEQVATAAAEAGFDAVSVPVGHASDATLSILKDHGLPAHDVLALMVAKNEKTENYARRVAEGAAAVNAPWVLCLFTEEPSPEGRKLFERCAAIIAESGARMAVEFNPFSPVSNIDAAVEVVDWVGSARAAVMIDTWHFFRGDSTFSQLEQVPLEKIAYVQFDDAPAPYSTDGYAETMNGRVFPGNGVFELSRFTQTLRNRDWEGVVSVEVLNSELSVLPIPEFARSAYQTSAPYWLD